MSWVPEATVTIGATDYTSSTVERVRITYGAQDPTDNFRPATGQVQILGPAAGITAPLMEEVVVTAEDSAGTVTLFTGWITDKLVEVLAPDWTLTTLTLMSPLSFLARRNVGASGFTEDYEGTRIEDIITEADATAYLGTIDTGSYTLHAYSKGLIDAISACQIAASSGLGHLYETTGGLICYADAVQRQNDAIANGYLDLQAGDVLIEGIESQQSTSSIANKATFLTYSGSEHSYTDTASVTLYGLLETTVDTWLKDGGVADDQAERYVGLYKEARPYLSSLTIPLSQVSTATRDDLLETYNGKPVRVYSLPSAVAPSPYAGFVEGWQWDIGRADALLTLTISDYALSVVSESWSNTNQTLTWATMNATVTWEDLEILT